MTFFCNIDYTRQLQEKLVGSNKKAEKNRMLTSRKIANTTNV